MMVTGTVVDQAHAVQKESATLSLQEQCPLSNSELWFCVSPKDASHAAGTWNLGMDCWVWFLEKLLVG